MLFFASCSVNKKSSPEKLNQYILTEEDRVWIEKFLKDIFLEESAIFTLCGSKPITSFEVTYYTPKMIGEMQEWHQSLPKEEKEQCFKVEYDLDTTWPKWEKFMTSFPMENYIFVKKNKPDYPNTDFIYFINKRRTIEVLKNHYKIFRRILGNEFEPEKLLLEVKDGNSSFWKIFEHSTTLGILFGFGKDNAFLFHWKYSNELDESVKEYVASFLSEFSEDPIPYIGKLSINNFPIPIFRSFYNYKDEVVEKYKKERVGIVKEYKNKNFVDFTLEKLQEN